MTTQNTNPQSIKSAAPGYTEVSADEVRRAGDATLLAQQNIALESKNLRADRHLGVVTVAQERRLEDARLDLDHAESFEAALENGQL